MKELKIHFLNTIWSDAIILEVNQKYGFVDTGSTFYYPMIEKHLEEYNIKELEFIILTHFHSDHYGNVLNIINNYKIKTIYLKHYHGLDGTTSSGYQSNEEYIETLGLVSEFNETFRYLKIVKTKIMFDDILDIQGSEIKDYNIN
jgi:beta-lactamase superfamily II metal-dependent hydrolase